MERYGLHGCGLRLTERVAGCGSPGGAPPRYLPSLSRLVRWHEPRQAEKFGNPGDVIGESSEPYLMEASCEDAGQSRGLEWPFQPSVSLFSTPV